MADRFLRDFSSAEALPTLNSPIARSLLFVLCAMVGCGDEDQDSADAQTNQTSMSSETSQDNGTAVPTSSEEACIGVHPSFVYADATETPSGASSEECKPGTCLDQIAPNWQALDFQPLSCGFGQTYGIHAFSGHVTLMVHLAGWCPYCQNQAAKLEKMRLEFEAEGVDVQILIVNMTTASSAGDQQNLLDRTSVPIFQDSEELGVWMQNGGNKDDFYLYRADGTLLNYIPHGGSIPTNLATDDGYAAIKNAILAATK